MGTCSTTGAYEAKEGVREGIIGPQGRTVLSDKE